MKRGFLSAVLFLLIISILFVSATIDVGNKSHYVDEIYGPSTDIRGWVNLSIFEEDFDLMVEDSFDNQISLIELLRANSLLQEDVDYFCNPVGCGASYSANLGEESKTISLDRGESKLLGFKLEGEIEGIGSSEFSIMSDVTADCSNQLEIDFFTKGEIKTGNTKTSPVRCSNLKNYGCFDSSKESTLRQIPGGGDRNCQRMTLSESSGFRLGAWLDIKEGAKTTKIAIYDGDLNEQLAECSLNKTPMAGELECEVDLLITERDEYYVCIFNDYGVDTNTQIRSYIDEIDGCGFYTSSKIETENLAYQIYVEGKKFGPIGTLNITDNSPIKTLNSEIYDYIYEAYGTYKCPTSGCIIPIKLTSKKDQIINISDISIDYTTSDFGSMETKKIYQLDVGSAVVSTSDFQKIYLDSSGFETPSSLGNKSYSVYFGEDSIFNTQIIIEPIPEIKSVSPMTTFTQFPINFFVSVEELNNASIVQYLWKFGSANPITTTTNKLEGQVFSSIGVVPLEITVTDVNGKSATKTFDISVGDYQSLFFQKLTKAKENIVNISAKLLTFPKFYQDGIKQVLDANALNQQVTAIEEAYDAASVSEEYAKVVTDFMALEIPFSIMEKINTDYVSFYTNKDAVNIQVVKEFLGGDFGGISEFEYAGAVPDWSVVNIDSKIKFKRINANYEGRSDPILNVFELNVKQTGDSDAPASIFIKQLENIQFDKAYGEEVKTGYIEIPLGGLEKTITFLATEEVDITDVPIFISPALQYLPLVIIEEEDVQGMRWALFVVILIFLIFVGLVAYVFLQHWYKTKYETYLFKDRNFLFNLVQYIDIEKKKGVKEGEIFKKLRKQGWNSEQINYVIRKYLGKRTGMLEIPVEKILKWFRKKPTPTSGNMPPKSGMRAPVRRPMGLKRGPIRPRKRFSRK